MPEPIDFYFEFASPYGYFASLQIDTIAANYDREVRWLPIMLGAALKETGGRPLFQTPLKAAYAERDLPRFARLIDAAFTMPEARPMNSLACSRAYWWLAAQDEDEAKGLAQALFHAHWGEGRDLSAADAVAEVAQAQGVERAALLDAVQDPAIKEKLKQETQRSIERGVFGSPFIIIDGEPFWGADRLEQVERWLATGGW